MGGESEMMLLQKWIEFSKYGEMLEQELEVLGFDFSRVTEMLPRMGIGMLVIFVVIGIIVLSTVVINKVFADKSK